ncbi:MAG: 5-(carboxyamino)imidazole ribonucleotide synthase [Nitrosopumilus sp.]|nr:5-(carboxyamino)imidazole ribonucleotide synthase [Nitrosopumilus sp.]
MGKILGIIGGGQLGMMLTEAAKRMPEEISKVIVLDPTKNCPATQVGAEQIISDFKDAKSIHELAQKSDIITYEIESGNSDVLKSVQGMAEVSPSPESLRIIQDKLLQKRFLSENQIPISEFIQVDSINDLAQGLAKFGYPALLKARRDAYDGRGNFKINSSKDVQEAFDYFNGQNLMLEKFVQFKKEVSVIVGRNTKGQIKTFPLVENIHENNILRETIAPARVSEEISNQAEEIAKKTITVLKGAGVFGIEMFVTFENDILVNEIAPRVHNSGHHTLQSSETSQFDQHLRAILGLELGGVKLLHPTVMFNILGPKDFEGEYMPIKISEENVFLKMYGKKISKPLRKLGHLNVVGNPGESIDYLLQKLESLKEKVRVIPST